MQSHGAYALRLQLTATHLGIAKRQGRVWPEIRQQAGYGLKALRRVDFIENLFDTRRVVLAFDFDSKRIF